MTTYRTAYSDKRTIRKSMKNKATPLDALLFAANKTNGFYTKSTTKPYVNHLIEMANILAYAPLKDTDELLVTGMLSELLENSDTTEEEIAGVFGDAILDKLVSLTDNNSLDAKERMAKRECRVSQLPCEGRLIEIARCIAQVDEVPKQWGLCRRLEYLEHLERVVKNCSVSVKSFNEHFNEKLFQARSSIMDEYITPGQSKSYFI